MDLTEKQVVDLLFEIYSAGYIDGFNHDKNPDVDIATSFKNWLKNSGIPLNSN